MTIIFCENDNCSRKGVRSPIANPKYVFRDGKLVPMNIPVCPECGKQMSYEEEKSTEMPNLSIGEFKMMSDSDKKKVLKERSKALSKKDNSEDKIRHYKEKAIRNMLNVKL